MGRTDAAPPPPADGRVRTLVLSFADYTSGPYGIDLLPRFGFDTRGRRPLRNRVARKVRDVVEHRSGMLVDIPARSTSLAFSADLVLGVLEPVSRLAASLRGRRIPPYGNRPMVMIACWLAEWIRQAPPGGRKRLVRQFGGLDLILPLSRNQVDILVDAGFRQEQVAPIPFGCAPSLFDGPPLERDIDVLAAGFDAGRDYATFFAGIRDLPVAVDLLCSPQNLAGLDVPANVRVHGVVPYDDYRKMMRRAKVVAVPTRELAYPTGQSVALDAAAAGAALAITGTAPIREYFSEATATLIAPGDAKGWGESLDFLLRDDVRRDALAQAATVHVRTHHDYDNMWQAFTDQLRDHGLPAPAPRSSR